MQIRAWPQIALKAMGQAFRDALQEIVPAGGETVYQPAGFEAYAAMNGVWRNDKTVARPDFADDTIYGKAEPAAFDIGRLNMRMAMQRAFGIFCGKVECHHHKLGVVGQNLARYVFGCRHNREICHRSVLLSAPMGLGRQDRVPV